MAKSKITKKQVRDVRELANAYFSKVHALKDARESILSAARELEDAVSYLDDVINGDWLRNEKKRLP